MQNITILGATGSIGLSTLDIISGYPDMYRVHTLVANSNVEKMFELVSKHHPQYVYLNDAASAITLKEQLIASNSSTIVLNSLNDLCQLIASNEIDTVMSAIVGAAGLKPTLAAVGAGKRVLLANKESLVMTGRLFMELARESGAEILPVDSEHNAIFQCLPSDVRESLGFCDLASSGIHKIILTASGGPFLSHPLNQLKDMTPAQACQHPNWSMGRKISVDSATMMNKGLEYIEARWLFNTSKDQLSVVIHPQSVIHSMVQCVDGSTLAQMGLSDMKVPISYSLSYPERQSSGVEHLNFSQCSNLTFQAVDDKRFPNMKLAIDACSAGQAASTILNAANEVFVQAFLDQRIKFTDIAALNQRCLDVFHQKEVVELKQILELDQYTRDHAQTFIKN